MSNFQASITNPTSGLPDITISGGVISVVDHSNYDVNSEQGHGQSFFTDFRKVRFINPDNSTYLFSTLGDGNATTIPAAGATLPITDNYTYSTGDGVYTVILETIPTWNSHATYSFVNVPYVFYQGNIYKNLQNSTGQTPSTNPLVWELVTDETTLPTKYRVEQKFSVDCDLQQCYARKTKIAVCGAGCTCNWETMSKNKLLYDAIQLSLILDGIRFETNAGNWTAVTQLITRGRQICCCQ